MTKLYVLTNTEVNELEKLMRYIGTVAVPYLPSSYRWVEYALEDAKACDFRKKAAQLTGHFKNIRFMPDLDDLEREFCSCGYEGDIGNGECTACHVGLREEFQQEPMTYTCRYCGNEDVEVFKECACLNEDALVRELVAPAQESYAIHLVPPSMRHQPRAFLSEEAMDAYISLELGGSSSCSIFTLHHLGGLKYGFDGFDEGVHDGKVRSGAYLYATEQQGVQYWHFTVDKRECSIRFTSLIAALVQLDNRLGEIDDEYVDAQYEESIQEGPYGGAFASQEDYENYRFGGISYLNSL